MSCPVRELTSERVDQSARCPVRELAIRELSSYWYTDTMASMEGLTPPLLFYWLFCPCQPCLAGFLSLCKALSAMNDDIMC